MKKMEKLMMFVILAVVVGLVSTVSAEPIITNLDPPLHYTVPGKTVEYTLTVFNNNSLPEYIAIEIDAGNCKVSWFDVYGTGMSGIYPRVPPYSVITVPIYVTPDDDALESKYNWQVYASTSEGWSREEAILMVQQDDYVGETYVEGTGVFTIDKEVRGSTMGTNAVRPFHVNVEKHFECRGSIDGFVNNQYLLKEAEGNNPNFKQVSMVNNYEAIEDDDFFSGDEDLRSSFIFGGTGARIKEEFVVRAMEERYETITLRSAGDQGYMTEIDSYNDFDTGLSEGYGGYFSLDARQRIPGIRIEESETFYGDLIVHKHLIFRRPPDDTFRDPGC